ncbi:MAG: hypothetical protein DIU68_004545 [Chloroflexota bacterium]|nr:MAG: hypothetical protein DIU68_11760 [Chloroflexota bacterium]
MRKFVIDPEKPFFIFDTRGDAHGVKLGPYLYDMRGEYIGYVRGEEYDVYTASGEWIGNLYPDGRIVRKRNYQRRPLDVNRPAPQPRIRITARVPLPPMAADLGFDKVDVLEWDDEIFQRISDLTPDLD